MAIEYIFNKDPRPIFIGYEEVDEDLRASNEEAYRPEFDPKRFPYYNIYKDGNKYYLVIQTTGFKKEDLEVSVDNEILVIKGNKSTEYFPESEKIYVGIKDPSQFARMLRIADNIILNSTQYSDGVLTITLQKVVSEEDKTGQYNPDYPAGNLQPPTSDVSAAPPLSAESAGNLDTLIPVVSSTTELASSSNASMISTIVLVDPQSSTQELENNAPDLPNVVVATSEIVSTDVVSSSSSSVVVEPSSSNTSPVPSVVEDANPLQAPLLSENTGTPVTNLEEVQSLSSGDAAVTSLDASSDIANSSNSIAPVEEMSTPAPEQVLPQISDAVDNVVVSPMPLVASPIIELNSSHSVADPSSSNNLPLPEILVTNTPSTTDESGLMDQTHPKEEIVIAIEEKVDHTSSTPIADLNYQNPTIENETTPIAEIPQVDSNTSSVVSSTLVETSSVDLSLDGGLTATDPQSNIVLPPVDISSSIPVIDQVAQETVIATNLSGDPLTVPLDVPSVQIEPDAASQMLPEQTQVAELPTVSSIETPVIPHSNNHLSAPLPIDAKIDNVEGAPTDTSHDIPLAAANPTLAADSVQTANTVTSIPSPDSLSLDQNNAPTIVDLSSPPLTENIQNPLVEPSDTSENVVLNQSPASMTETVAAPTLSIEDSSSIQTPAVENSTIDISPALPADIGNSAPDTSSIVVQDENVDSIQEPAQSLVIPLSPAEQNIDESPLSDQSSLTSQETVSNTSNDSLKHALEIPAIPVVSSENLKDENQDDSSISATPPTTTDVEETKPVVDSANASPVIVDISLVANT